MFCNLKAQTSILRQFPSAMKNVFTQIQCSFNFFQLNKSINKLCLNLFPSYLPVITIPDEEQFQLVTWAKDSTLRLWAIEPRMLMVSSRKFSTCELTSSEIKPWPNKHTRSRKENHFKADISSIALAKRLLYNNEWTSLNLR